MARVDLDQAISSEHNRRAALLNVNIFGCIQRTFTRWRQSKSQNVVGGTHKTHLVWKLLIVDGFCGKNRQFSFRMWSLKGRVCSSDWGHIDEYVGSPNLFLDLEGYKTKQDINAKGGSSCVHLEGTRGVRH